MRRRASQGALVLIVFAVLSFVLLPVLVVIPASFTAASFPSFPPKGFSFQWYLKILDRPEFITAFKNSVMFAFLAASFSLVLGTLAGLAVARYAFPGKTFIVTFMTAPLTVPQLVLGIALIVYFTPFHLSGTPLGFLISHVIITLPYVVRFVLAGLSGFDYTLERAAMILGARPFKVFWHITFPLLRPALISGGMFAFLTSFDNVTVSLFMVSPQMRTLPLEIFSHMQDAYSPIVASVSSVVVFISVLFIAVLERLYGVGRLFTSQ